MVLLSHSLVVYGNGDLLLFRIYSHYSGDIKKVRILHEVDPNSLQHHLLLKTSGECSVLDNGFP